MKKRLKNLNLSEEELEDFIKEVSFILKDCVLTPEKVQYITQKCLYTPGELEGLKEGELPKGCISVNGITHKFIFNPFRIEAHRLAIELMLNEIHPIFDKGYTFLDFCYNKNDVLWTGEHFIMESLMALGMAIGKVHYCTKDRDLWTMFPLELPYIIIY